jgi:putative transposase
MVGRYSSDLSDQEWEIVEGFFNARRGKQGRPPPRDLREVLNGIFYVTKNGCTWADLPKDFPDWKRVYNFYSRLKLSGKLESLWQSLHGKVRVQAGRDPVPSLGIIDSQSVRSCSQKKSGQGH